jgi:hypothetical protein
MELAQDRVHWLALVLVVLTLPSGSAATVLVSMMDLKEIICEDGRWMDGTGSGSCPVAGFCIGSVDHSSSAVREFSYSNLQRLFGVDYVFHTIIRTFFLKG